MSRSGRRAKCASRIRSSSSTARAPPARHGCRRRTAGRGWAHYFVDQGYIVYITDQPARGRSIYDAQHQGKQIRVERAGTERNNTAAAELRQLAAGKAPHAVPGRRRRIAASAAIRCSTPAFARAVAVPRQQRRDAAARAERGHGAARPHRSRRSSSRTRRPGPSAGCSPMRGRSSCAASSPSSRRARPSTSAIASSGPARPWGPTDIRITYDPPVNDPKELRYERRRSPMDPISCCARCRPAPRGRCRTSRHPDRDPHGRSVVSRAIRSLHVEVPRAGRRRRTSTCALEKRGIRGNGHGIPSEMNSLDVAASGQQVAAGEGAVRRCVSLMRRECVVVEWAPSEIEKWRVPLRRLPRRIGHHGR